MNKGQFPQPKEVIHELIRKNGYFPNNPEYPFLVYKNMAAFTDQTPDAIQAFLRHNQWINSWVDGIYKNHHYHSNTHELLVVIAGDCQVQIGGDQGKIYEIARGDIIILPAGVAHKNTGSSSDFKCIGAYPFDVECDMNYGKAEEHPQVVDNIKRVGLPARDPVFGAEGLLFDYWK
ncbi:TPA: cupin domain-containing protein [Legionella feeleii]